MNDPKFFIGPMSKNIVDAIIEFVNEKNVTIALIPSRRQIEFTGGYVNNWKTEEFTQYVKSKTQNIILQRDHAGAGQGYKFDSGYDSLKNDCWNFDLIHIDPFKLYPNYREGLKETAEMIKFCDTYNPHLQYEIGTEESIRRFGVEELGEFVSDLSFLLGQELFDKIKYLVIQSGTSLKGNNQTGTYDKERLVEMVKLAKYFKMLSKEHNGDYISEPIIKEKFDLGLDAINIAPEFGLIETQTYLDRISNAKLFRADYHILNEFYKICYSSKRWEKWVDKDFIPEENKEQLIKICGHYVLSDQSFLDNVKVNFPDINEQIKNNVKIKLTELWKILGPKQ